MTSHFILTTRRVMRRSGWIAKESMEIPIDRITDVRFRQSVAERIIKAGSLTIESAGRSGQERLDHCRNPEAVRRLIHDMRERELVRIEGSDAAPVAAERWGPASVADELTKLHQLVERGVLTGDEFDHAKTRLLRRV
jgi:uncharacterized membrane protein YdbT with pleckstrin-like domain